VATKAGFRYGFPRAKARRFFSWPLKEIRHELHEKAKFSIPETALFVRFEYSVANAFNRFPKTIALFQAAVLSIIAAF
jgi:hypothetical protein